MGRRILIYGGSGAIGSATGRALYERGYELHLVGRNAEKLRHVSSELGAGYTAGDVLEEGFFARVTERVHEPLDGLVYAVGSLNLRSLQRLTEHDFLHDFRLNASGAALAVQAALPLLKRNSGTASVVLISSIAALQGFSFHASMGMAKGAVAGLALSLAAELAPKVRVNAVAPSLTQTPMSAGMLANEQLAKGIAERHALQRLGAPDDIGAMAAFLVSTDADWITGQVIGVDGGRSTVRTRS